MRAICNRIMRTFIKVCHEINFPVEEDKTEWAVNILTFLGILLNGRTFTLMVPNNKRWKAINILTKFCSQKKVTVKDVEILTRTLNFLSRAIILGRVFTRHLYSKLEGKTTTSKGVQLKHFHHVYVDKEIKNDCDTWIKFLLNQTAVNRPFVDLEMETRAEDIQFFTDSSRNPNLGFGCFFGKNRSWTFGRWETRFVQEMQPSIAYLELFALCVGVFCWREELANMTIFLHCDNEAVVNMVNNCSSKCRNCMYLLRMLTLNNLLYNRRVKVIYVSSKNNLLADSLSRQDLKKFFIRAPRNIWKYLAELPSELWPLSKIWQR